jgi:hypothetical protein
MTTSSNSISEGLSMNTEAIRCPKCNGVMVQGFIGDKTDWGYRVSIWVEGAPAKATWFDTSVPADKYIPVGTFRCSTCGFLESYAHPEFAAK